MYIRRETPQEAADRIMERLKQCQGLDIRTHEYHRRMLDHTYLTAIPHLIDGVRWDEAMQIVYARYRVTIYRDLSAWSHWIPALKAGFGLFGDVDLKKYFNTISRDAQVCQRTYEFSLIAPKLIWQPSHGIIELGRGKRGSGSMERFLHSHEAWRTQKPVVSYDGEVVPVPDPAKFSPPHLPATGDYQQAREDAKRFSEKYGREDALASDAPLRLEFVPEPPAGYRWTDEYLLGWKDYRELYLNVFDAVRGDVEGTRYGQTLGADDKRAGLPRRREITYQGPPRSGAFTKSFESAATDAYDRAYDSTKTAGDGGDDIDPGDIDIGPDDGPDDDDDERTPTGAQHRAMCQALAKAVAFKRVRKDDEADQWSQELVSLLRESEMLFA